MTQQLYQAIDDDTPKNVNVPTNPYSLLWYAVGKFGAGIVLAAAMGFWLIRIDDRSALREDKVLEVLMYQAEAQAQTAKAMEAHTHSLEAHTQAIRDLSRQAEISHSNYKH